MPSAAGLTRSQRNFFLASRAKAFSYGGYLIGCMARRAADKRTTAEHDKKDQSN
jgi:hypothetical protein